MPLPDLQQQSFEAFLTLFRVQDPAQGYASLVRELGDSVAHARVVEALTFHTVVRGHPPHLTAEAFERQGTSALAQRLLGAWTAGTLAPAELQLDVARLLRQLGGTDTEADQSALQALRDQGARVANRVQSTLQRLGLGMHLLSLAMQQLYSERRHDAEIMAAVSTLLETYPAERAVLSAPERAAVEICMRALTPAAVDWRATGDGAAVRRAAQALADLLSTIGLQSLDPSDPKAS